MAKWGCGTQSKNPVKFTNEIASKATGSFDSAPRRLRPPRRSAANELGSFSNSARIQPCHPERSAAVERWGCGTESKDLTSFPGTAAREATAARRLSCTRGEVGNRMRFFAVLRMTAFGWQPARADEAPLAARSHGVGWAAQHDALLVSVHPAPNMTHACSESSE